MELDGASRPLIDGDGGTIGEEEEWWGWWWWAVAAIDCELCAVDGM